MSELGYLYALLASILGFLGLGIGLAGFSSVGGSLGGRARGRSPGKPPGEREA